MILPFSTKVLHASDFGTYAMLMAIVALVGTAIDGGASILLPAHYGLASSAERRRIYSSLAAFAALPTCFGAPFRGGLRLLGASFTSRCLRRGFSSRGRLLFG